MDYIVTTINRSIALIPGDDLLDLLLYVKVTLESQEYWLSIGILLVYNPGPIVLLPFECEFMFLDQIVFVVINASETKNAMLHMVPHLLLVDIDPCLCILHEEPALSEFFERVFTKIIYLLRIWVSVHWQINLWLDHVQETQWVSSCHLPGLSCVKSVVCGRQDAFCKILFGQVTFESSEVNHIKIGF